MEQCWWPGVTCDFTMLHLYASRGQGLNGITSMDIRGELSVSTWAVPVVKYSGRLVGFCPGCLD